MAQNVAGPSNHHSFRLLIAAAWLTSAGLLAHGQTSPVPPPPTQPAYEVATIKPPGPNDYAMPLRQYIQIAFGIPGNSTGWVFGPEWVNSAKYVIHGKPPDSLRNAMKAMSPAQRGKEEQLMMQGLLADRFKLTSHFETRVMPVYELTVAKDGPKLKENSDTGKGMAALGASRIRATAVPIHELLMLLEGTYDIGGRVVIDKTGLSGTYDFDLKWAPLQPATPPSGSTGTAPSSDSEGASLFTSIEEQLGLKLVPTKGPGQVLVIDHIERPSEN